MRVALVQSQERVSELIKTNKKLEKEVAALQSSVRLLDCSLWWEFSRQVVAYEVLKF